MKHYIKKNMIPLILLALAVLVSIAVVAGRWRVEANNKTYDVVMDYSELELLAEQSDHDIRWWLEQFRDMGITQVGLTEESLATLMENSPMAVTATPMDAVMQDSDWMESYPASFIREMEAMGYDRFDVLVEMAGSEAAGFVLPAVERRFKAGSYCWTAEGDRTYVLLDGTVSDALYRSTYNYVTTDSKAFTSRRDIESSKLMYISLGLLPEKVELIQSVGMEVSPRTICYKGFNGEDYARAVVEDYERLGVKPSYIIAGGEAVLGYDDCQEAFALDYFQENDITIGLIETNVQRENIMQSGVEDIAAATDYNTVRVFSVWDYIQMRYAYYGYEGAEEIENTLYRAIVERNIRVIYFKPVKQTNDAFVYVTDIDVYRDLFQSLNQRLSAHGISMGSASVMENYQIPRLALLALGLGAGIGGALLPDTFLPMKKKWTLILAGAAAVCVAAAWRIMPNTYRLLASFASAVVFACLATAFFLQSAKQSGEKLPDSAGLGKILPRAMGILVLSVLISLAGAMMTAAPLSSTDFMLELGIFRGVKAAQLLPLAYFCLLFFAYYGLFKRDRKGNTLQMEDILSALRWTIPVWAIMVAAVIGAAGYYYIARTGHETTVTVTNLEIIFRNDLENLLLARPRTKEFLAAFPCIMLAVYCAVRRLPFFTALFGLVGTVGLTSVCNTFMHIRTPLYLGFARTACSLALGILLGVVYTVFFELLYRLWLRIKKYYAGVERK